MSVAPGVDWGEPAPLPESLAWFGDDASAAEHLAAFRRSGETLPAIGLAGGDLFRTLGGRAVPQDASEALSDDPRGHGRRAGAGVCYRADLGAVLLDGRLHWFLAHCVLRRSWLRGRVLVAANAAFVGAWNLAPRAHPGDGRLDVLDADPSLGDRWRARRRLRAGSHVPHPDIAERRVRSAQFDLGHPVPAYLDGARAGTARQLSLRVEPEAVEVWIRAGPSGH